MRYSLRRGKTTRWKVIKCMVDYLRYRYDLLNMETAYQDSLRPLVGVREEELVQFSQEWFKDAIRPVIYPEAFDFVHQHLERGEIVAIISNAITHAVAPLAEYLGVSHILATQLEVRQGIFTGDYIKPLCFRDGKVFWAEKLARELGADLGQSIFYTDSITDLPLLVRVKNPRVVNPDPKLRRLARRMEWPVWDFPPVPRNKDKKEKASQGDAFSTSGRK
ncbi:MAG: HAD family hydrolase [Planctomycetaceae bacterium]